jgi:hypothetical protein
MIIRPLDFEWSPDYSIFASKNFLQSVSDQYGWIGGYDDSGNLACVLPYIIIKKGPIRLARFRVETILIKADLSVDQEKQFLNQMIYYLKELGVATIIPASTNCLFRTFPDGARAAPYGSHIIDLSNDEEALWNKVHQKHRNVIRSAERKGVKVEEGSDHMRSAYNLIKETFRRSRMSFMNYEMFKNMILSLGDNVKIMVATYEGKCQACAIIPFSHYRAYYMYGGTAIRPITGSMNYLQWKSIVDLKALGVKSYDFCGARIAPDKDSKAARLIMYKERFGGKLYGGFIWKYSLNPIWSKIYDIAVRLLRGGDIVDAEHHKLSGFKIDENNQILSVDI